jgi:hypothetical protein
VQTIETSMSRTATEQANVLVGTLLYTATSGRIPVQAIEIRMVALIHSIAKQFARRTRHVMLLVAKKTAMPFWALVSMLVGTRSH